MEKSKNLEGLRKLLEQGGSISPGSHSKISYPPPIAKTLGCKLVAVDEATATVELNTLPEIHANPMGTVHGGVLADVADLAIGTAHSTTLFEGESFTSIDLQINFFRPVWKDTIRAIAKLVHQGKTVSRYVCDITRADGKLVAQVTSTVITLRGQAAAGR